MKVGCMCEWDGHQCPHCVSPDTRVLTADLQWVAAGSILAGDRLLAFDEEPYVLPGGRLGRRLYRSSVVESISRELLPCYDLVFDDGTKVRSSSDHLWLTRGQSRRASWLSTEKLACNEKRSSRVIKPLGVWEPDSSRDAGYLAAAFDGEGYLVQSPRRGSDYVAHQLQFPQVDNEMLAEVERCLKELGYEYTYWCESRARLGHQTMHRFGMYRRAEIVRFLGSVRPVRLLPKFQPDKLGVLPHIDAVCLVSKTFVGVRPVVSIQTESRTLFAEGLASHNCDYYIDTLSPAKRLDHRDQCHRDPGFGRKY